MRAIMKEPHIQAYIQNPRGHVWKADEDGDIDIFGYDSNGGYCNGPVCVNCGYGFCHHCNYEGPKIDCTAAGKGSDDAR